LNKELDLGGNSNVLNVLLKFQQPTNQYSTKNCLTIFLYPP